MLSFGMFSFFAAAIAVRKRGFEFASPPPMRAAIGLAWMILVNAGPRCASVAAFWCLIVAHFECPDMTIPRFAWPGSGLGHRLVVISRRNGVAQSRPFTVAQRKRHQCGIFR